MGGLSMMRFVEAAIEGLESLSPEMIEAELPDDSGGKYSLDDLPDDSGGEMANLGLSPEERAQFQQESGWSDQIMDSLRSPPRNTVFMRMPGFRRGKLTVEDA